MIKFIKVSTIIILILLALASIFLLALQTLASIIVVATGALFIYFLIVLSITYAYNKKAKNKLLYYIICILFFVPVVWFLVSPESLFELLMFDVKLDMK